jgi:hypothetical protein
MGEMSMDTPTLYTRRLILRPLALSDASAIQRHFNNWNIIQNLATVATSSFRTTMANRKRNIGK